MTSPAPKPRRVALFDLVRGFTIVSMCLFHLCYDLAYLYGVDMPWFADTLFQTVWRASISWTFLFLAGWMTSFSRSNLKRGLFYAAAALTVFIATSVASVDTPVTFGILFCMAASTLLYALAEPLLRRVPAPVLLVAAVAVFAATYALPQGRYTFDGLSWLGFPSPTFTSGDYYPLLPYAFMYLAGAAAARWHAVRSGGAYPPWAYRDVCPPLAAIGRASLPIYLVHQPLILLVLSLVFR